MRSMLKQMRNRYTTKDAPGESFSSLSNAQVASSANRADANLKQFPKPLQVVAKVGSALGSLVNPMEAEENAYRLTKKLKKK